MRQFKLKYLIACFFVLLFACNDEHNRNPVDTQTEQKTDSLFNKVKWDTKKGESYPFRELMLNNVLYNDTIRNLNKAELIEMLGAPDRENNNYLYYLIKQKKLYFITISAKYLVVKFNDEDKIEWIKTHN